MDPLARGLGQMARGITIGLPRALQALAGARETDAAREKELAEAERIRQQIAVREALMDPQRASAPGAHLPDEAMALMLGGVAPAGEVGGLYGAFGLTPESALAQDLYEQAAAGDPLAFALHTGKPRYGDSERGIFDPVTGKLSETPWSRHAMRAGAMGAGTARTTSETDRIKAEVLADAAAGNPDALAALGHTRFSLGGTGAVFDTAAGTVTQTPQSEAGLAAAFGDLGRTRAEAGQTVANTDLMKLAGAGNPDALAALGHTRFSLGGTGAVFDTAAGTVTQTPQSLSGLLGDSRDRGKTNAEIEAATIRNAAGRALLPDDPVTVFTGTRPPAPGGSAGTAAAPGLRSATDSQVMSAARAAAAQMYGGFYDPQSGRIIGLDPNDAPKVTWLATQLARDHNAAAYAAMAAGGAAPDMGTSFQGTLSRMGFQRPSFSGPAAPAAAPSDDVGGGRAYNWLSSIFGGDDTDERGVAPADAGRVQPGDAADPLGLNAYRPPR